MNVEEIPTPPEARQGSINGGYEVELDAATNSILSGLKQNYPKVGEKILFLPGDIEPANIFEFYNRQLSEKGFTKDASVPLNSRNYQSTVWRKDNQAVAAAVIDAGKDGDGKAIKFLAVYFGEK